MGDYKSFLFLWCAKNKRPSPDIKFRDGASTQQKRFICELTMNDYNYVAVGNSTSKKDAQLNAARDYVQYLVRSKVVTENDLKTYLRDEGSEILGSSSTSKTGKQQPLGLNKPSVSSVFRAGVGPQSLGVAYQPVNTRPPVDFSALDKRTVDEQETLDVNAAIHGNWTVIEAKNRLNQFMQTNKIKGEYKFSFIGPDNAKTFIAELTIFVPQLGRKITGRESGSSKQAASKSCALSLIRQLFHLGVVERCSSITGTAPKRLEQMPPYEVNLDPQLLENISNCLHSFGVDWESGLSNVNDGVMVLLPGRQGENPEDSNKRGRVVTWSPPQANWDPWRGANIDDTNPNLASASVEYISDELMKGLLVSSREKDRILKERSQLPIYGSKVQIMDLVSKHPVIIVKGATGCGKTTQVCQYILDSWIEEGRGGECNIVVTQPRRISAISVAERVSRERCEEMGVSVGYSVRFESVLPRPYGALLFCTVGVLLRKLELGLRGISHVIVDEIHERDVNTDFLLVVLRDTLHVYPDLRVILMSATVDTELFSNYFNNCPVIEVPGRCFDVLTFFLEDTIEMLKFVPPPPSKKKSKSEPDESEEEDDLSEEYDQSTKDSLALLDDKEIPFELIHEILLWCRKRGDGAVLIFLPGWSTIFSLMKRLLSSYEFRKPSYVILPLHSQLPREEQKLVFEQPPPGVMKVILATNIAESSITINDVVYVIDCCKVKVKMFTSHNNMIHYATVWASRSNMEQRAGRAGRTANGFCFRLCTKSRYGRLEEHIVAEMLRSSLEELALNIKLLGLGSVSHFLSKALEPPPLDAVIEAQVLLKEMSCLDENYDLTSLGRLIAKLPLEPHLAKMVITGCILELGDAATAIASNISLASEVFDIEVSMTGRQRWFGGTRCSDQFAMLNAFQRFTSMAKRGLEAQQTFTCVNELSLPALVITGEAKSQIQEILTSCYFPPECMQPMKFDFGGEDSNLDILAGLLTIGSYPNVCFHKERRKVLTMESKPALIIKTSINFSKYHTNYPSPFFVFSEKLRTKTVYCKTLSMVTPLHLLLFGCNQVEVVKDIVRLDGWVQFDMDPKAAALVLGLRPLFENIITNVATSPEYIYQMPEEEKNIIALVKELCNFNSGRYNMTPYQMTKEVRVNLPNRMMMGTPQNSLQGASCAVGQLTSQIKNSVYVSSNENDGRVSNTALSNNKDNDNDSVGSDSVELCNHPGLILLKESEIVGQPSSAVKAQGSKEVKLDRNTSRAVLSRHQKSDSKISATEMPPSIQKPVEEIPKRLADDDYCNQNAVFQQPPARRTKQNPETVHQYPNQYGYNRYSEYQYSGNDIQNPFNNANTYEPPYANRPGVNARNQRAETMYRSANYYRQRYSQQYYNDSEGSFGEQQAHQNTPYIRGNMRRPNPRGRGSYPAY